MWECPNCSKSVEDGRSLCWDCGTSQSGDKDPMWLEVEKLDKEWLEEVEQNHSSVPRLKRRQIVARLALLIGFVLVLGGRWLHALGDDVRLERLLHPWPWVCIGSGVIAVLGWAVSELTTGSDRHRIRMYSLEEYGYLFLRQKTIRSVTVAVGVWRRQPAILAAKSPVSIRHHEDV